MRFWLLGFLIFLAACGSALPPPRADIVGEYTIYGTNPDGSSYEGGMSIRDGNPYRFEWRTGDRPVQGVAVVAGDLSAAAYGPAGCSVALYQLNTNGTLEGIWAADGMIGIGNETATPPLPSQVIGGQYAISGRNPDGSSYTGSLEIELKGERFDFTWYAPNSVSGVAFQRGRYIAAGYGGPGCGVAIYQRTPDGNLDGTWLLPAPADPRIVAEQAIRR